MASSDVMRGIESSVILEKCILTSYLNNAESWHLSLTDEKELIRSVLFIYTGSLPGKMTIGHLEC